MNARRRNWWIRSWALQAVLEGGGTVRVPCLRSAGASDFQQEQQDA